jgi:hypothetical protein
MAQIRRDLARLEIASARARDRRAALPPGSSRARVTTANARWARLAEARDLVERELADAERAEALAEGTVITVDKGGQSD